jgi:cysteine-rich repeat protein
MSKRFPLLLAATLTPSLVACVDAPRADTTAGPDGSDSDGGAGATGAGGGGATGGQNAGGQNTGGQNTGGTGGQTRVVCGDGFVGAGEGCDDGDTDDGDGCSADCLEEPYSSCYGEPSDCVTPTIVAVNFGGELYRIDSTTGAASLVGPVGFANFGSLSVGPMNLLTIETEVSQPERRLILIERIGGVGIDLSPIGDNTLNFRATAMTQNATIYGIDDIGDNLYTIDFGTGETTLVGPTGATAIHSLDLTADGVLYGWNNDDNPAVGGLNTIEPATGAATDVDPVLSVHPSAIHAIAAAPGDTSFYAVDDLSLLSIDRASGDVTTIGPTNVPTLVGLEVLILPAPSVP